MKSTRVSNITILIVLLVFFLTGCSESSSPQFDNLPSLRITLITSTGGNGDNGYNDLILAGIMRYYNRHEADVWLSMRQPVNADVAREYIEDWILNTQVENGTKSRSLLILASSEYENILREKNPELKDYQRILLFESDGNNLPEGVSSFRIGRYGAAYLAGLMAGESPESYIISALPENGLLKDAEQGFSEGYQFASQGKTAVINYLSENEMGFSMPEKAYDLVKDLDEVFIFPLAGGSNNGIYRYSREDYFTLLLIAGMDVDCSDYSTRIPFSMLTHIDKILETTLEEWHNTGSLSSHKDYFMGEGVEIIVNSNFLDRVISFKDYYSNPDYWQQQKEKWINTAKDMERNYYDQ